MYFLFMVGKMELTLMLQMSEQEEKTIMAVLMAIGIENIFLLNH